MWLAGALLVAALAGITTAIVVVLAGEDTPAVPPAPPDSVHTSAAPLPPSPPPLALPLPGVPLPLPPPAPSLAIPVPTVPPPAPAVPSCEVRPGARPRDVDPVAQPDAPWPRARAQAVVVFFETGALPPRYADAVRQGADLWSRAACVRAIAVPRCPPRSNCTTVTTAPRGDGADNDGNAASRERGGRKVGEAITLYTEALATSSDRAALGTVVHEMGHALGVDHRLNPNSIMSAVTGEETDPRPDPVDYANLAALYGDRV